ncbi:hypothetical protein lbkm_4047 [Lachnospiraceae bacterium KM106-2]|nr:hypothetical protein lbkm_4047 [Lachnospiraceae bacterium KM106-2]
MDKNKIDNLDDTLDWEYMSDFYTNEDKEIGDLEDYIVSADETPTDENILGNEEDDTLRQILDDVKKVRECNDSGKNVAEIATVLDMDEEYVTLILMTLNGNPEDSNDLAIAHLIELG